MPYVLNVAYLAILLLASPWLLWQAMRKGKYREGFAEKLLGLVPRRQGGRTCVWLHAVSVGEVNLLATLLREIAHERPEWECVVSTTTMTGMALARKKYPQVRSFYCPLDFSWAVRTAVRRVRPDLLVLAELELWPNLVGAVRAAGARVAVINGRLSEHSFRGYRRIRPLVASLVRRIDVVAVQDATYADRFLTLGARPEAVHVTGSMKYDGAETDRGNPHTRRLSALAGFGDDDVIFLAGSTQEPEEAAALAAFQQLSPHWPRLRLVIVPRHPDRFDGVARLLDQSTLPWLRRSMLGQAAVSTSRSPELPSGSERVLNPPSKARILLVDAVGELGAWWGAAQIAFVGGSLGNRGGQNMIEPAAYGVAVCFGPNTRNFRDIVAALLERGAAEVVADEASLTAFVRRCLEEPAYGAELGRRAKALVAEQLGATKRTFALLASLVQEPTALERQRKPLSSRLLRAIGRG